MVAKEEKLTIKDLKARTDGNEMDLSLLQIETVPVKDIASVTKANYLDLSCNRIVQLPDDFCTLLHYLVKLDLSKNRLSVLPGNIHHLHHIKQLDLFQNNLSALPLEFGKLTSLKWLDLKDNPLEPTYAEFVGDCLDDKQCRQCAVNVVSQMQIMADNHEQELVKKMKQAKKKEAQKSAKIRKQAEKMKQEKKQEKERRRKEWEEEQEAMADLLESRDSNFVDAVSNEANKPKSKTDVQMKHKQILLHKLFWASCFIVMFVSVIIGSYFLFCGGREANVYCVSIDIKLIEVQLTWEEYINSFASFSQKRMDYTKGRLLKLCDNLLSVFKNILSS